jgi:DNA end-binding protein Ku
MPRSIWNGTISFGLAHVPVKLYTATESKTVHFHEVHAKDGARIEHKRICSKEGKEVPFKQVVKGYEVSEAEYVVLTNEEIAAASGTRSKLIDVEEFVPAGDIDPVFYDRTYYLGAREEGCDAYRLLHDALAKAERVAIGRWVFHNREYLVAVRARDDVLALHTMRFADELIDPGELDISRPSRKPSAQEIKMAATLVDSLHAKFDPTAFEDSYREAVVDLIRRKAKGEEIEPAAPEGTDEDADLEAVLEASLKSARRSRSRS